MTPDPLTIASIEAEGLAALLQADNERLQAEVAVLTEKLAQAWRERDLTLGRATDTAEQWMGLKLRLQPILDAWGWCDTGTRAGVARWSAELAAALDDATKGEA